MKNRYRRTLQLFMAATLAVCMISCTTKPELNALIITGQNNHKWQGSHPVLKSILEKTEIFKVQTAISPGTGRDMSTFEIDFTPFDVVVLDYTGDNWPEVTKNNFLSYVKNGGGVVVYHASNNAFPEWEEFNKIIGLGGWGNRNEDSGPYVYIKDGEVVRDDSPGQGGSHGPQHEFVIETNNSEHPIMKGLPTKWLHIQDELYQELRGPAENMEILATAFADEKYKGTGRHEPMLMTISYGEGRIFHTAIGHAGGTGMFYPAMECAGFITTLQRGAEWAATGKVTQEIPEGLPSETNTVRWKYLERMDLEIIKERISEFETGKTNNCFVALKDLVNDNISDSAKMDEYHKLIIDVLSNGKASKEGKRVLLTEFSWFATDTYKPVLEQLKSDPDLKDEATYALDLIK